MLQPEGLEYERVSLAGQGTAVEIRVPQRGLKGAGNYPSLDGIGRYVTFVTQGDVAPYGPSPNDNKQLYYRDLQSSHTGLVSGTTNTDGPGNGRTDPPSAGSIDNDFSRNGRYIVFQSFSGALDADDAGPPNHEDTFIFDVQTDELERVSERLTDQVDADGRSGKAHVTQCGRYVVFQSQATNLQATPLFDATALPNCAPGGPVLIQGNKNIFILDRGGPNVPVDPSTAPGAEFEWISIGWRFGSNPSAPGCAEPDGNCFFPTVSDDGGRVAFVSDAANLVPGRDLSNYFQGATPPDQVYVWHRSTQEVELISQRPIAEGFFPANAKCQQAQISGDGQFVAYASLASNLLGADVDQNDHWDVFVRDIDAQTTTRVSVRKDGSTWPDDLAGISMRHPVISWDGRFTIYGCQLNPDILVDPPQLCEYIVDSLSEGLLYDAQANSSIFVTKAPDGQSGFKQSNGFVGFPADFTDDAQHVVFLLEADDVMLPQGSVVDQNGRLKSNGLPFTSCLLTQDSLYPDPCTGMPPLPCNDVAHNGSCPCALEGNDIYMRQVWQ